MTEQAQKASKARVILGSLLVAILGYFHFSFLFQGNGAGIAMLLLLALMIYLSFKKERKEMVKHFQYKTASILSFLLPVSAIIFSFIFGGTQITQAEQGVGQAGAALGSVIGGSLIIGLSFVFGLSLGIAFYLMSNKQRVS